jgi:hypothetical protein
MRDGSSRQALENCWPCRTHVVRQSRLFTDRISELKPCEESLPTVISAFGTPVRTATLHVDQNKVPNNLLVNEPSLSTQGIGGSSGR